MSDPTSTAPAAISAPDAAATPIPGEESESPLSYNCEDYAADVADTSAGDSKKKNSATLWQSIQGKLYDRELHQQCLLEAYRRHIGGRICNNDDINNGIRSTPPPLQQPKEMVLITGPSGTGKSYLAKSIYQQALDDHAYILYGKSNQIQKSEPLAPFVHALTQFVHEVLERGATDRTIVERVQTAMERATADSNVEYLTDMIPAFSKLLVTIHNNNNGSVSNSTHSKTVPRRTASNISGHESNKSVNSLDTSKSNATSSTKRSIMTNRTRPNAEIPGIAIVCKLLQEVCRYTDFSMVLFIDDLQWLDPNSIQMLRTIAATKLPNFFLVATCRGDEVSRNDELAVMLRELEEIHELQITEIQVSNLQEHTVRQMIQELLQTNDPDEMAPLAALAYRLTSGNPFFCVEFIRSLFDERLLYMDEHSGKWTWSESEIFGRNQALESAEISDAIVQGVIRHEHDPIRDVLQIASCLGVEFTQRHLQLAASQPPQCIFRAVQVLVFRQIILTTDQAGRFRWAHDRFQKSAFQLIPDDQCAEFQFAIGRKLLDAVSREELIDNAFLLSGLLFDGARFIQNEAERQQVAELFSISGEKAAHSSAFEDAAGYFRKGIELLPPDHWERAELYDQCQHLYNCLAEMECCLGNNANVDDLCSTILKKSKNLEDQMRAYDTQIYSLSARNEMNESIRVGLDVLRKLGEPVPRKIGMLQNIRDLVVTRRMLKRFTAEDILALQPLQKWEKAATLQIINLLFPSVLRSQPQYALFLTAKAIKITLRDGLSPLSAVLFSMFSMILCNPVGAIEEGLRIEEIGYQIFEKFQAYYLRSRMMVIRYAYAKPWTEPMSECLPPLLTGASSGMLTGDFELAFINAFVYCIDGLLSGLPLPSHFENMIRFKQQFSAVGQETVMFYLNASIQLARNLQGEAKDARILSGEEFDAEKSLDAFEDTNNAAGVCYTLLPMLFLAVFTGNYQEAVVVARRIQRANNDNYTAFCVQYIAFLSGLCEMIVARQTKSRSNRRAAKRALKRLEKVTKYSSEHWQSRILLIQAERDALRGLREAASRKFFFSIEEASRLGLVHEQALALERTGIFLLESNQLDKGMDCLNKAHDMYDEWGCVVKTSMMIELIDTYSTSTIPATFKNTASATPQFINSNSATSSTTVCQ